MQQGDQTSAPYYQYPHPPNPTHHQPSISYVSSPPFTTTNYPQAPPLTTDFSSFPSLQQSSYPQLPNPLPTAPSFTPPPPQQPQPLPSFPQFDSSASFKLYPHYPSYDPPSNAPPNHNANPSLAYPSVQDSQFVSPTPILYNNSYEISSKFHQNTSYCDDYPSNYDPKRFDYDRYANDGVYAYQGSKLEPYGARGTAPKSSTWSGFDDFGRPIGYSSNKDRPSASSGVGLGTKIVKAVPKAEVDQDVKSGVQKFRVKLLAESGGQTMDVLCQVGLDGIRMLDPSTGRTLRIYPLDTITRCDVIDSSTFAFWSKSTVDLEPRRIRLKSNIYTTNTILDIVTAATVQFKEMGGTIRPPESSKMSEQPPDRRKGFADLINLIKPVNEEKDYWVPDEVVSKCTACGTDFGAFVRKHHCRNCGDIFCDKCTHGRIALTAEYNAPAVRVCDRCLAEVSRRLSNAKETASRSSGLQSHEDLAKRLQEEMGRNRKLSVSRSDGSSRRMKEVACPTCTVHLQVQVSSSVSETIECGVCQHPFLVSAD